MCLKAYSWRSILRTAGRDCKTQGEGVSLRRRRVARARKAIHEGHVPRVPRGLVHHRGQQEGLAESSALAAPVHGSAERVLSITYSFHQAIDLVLEAQAGGKKRKKNKGRAGWEPKLFEATLLQTSPMLSVAADDCNKWSHDVKCRSWKIFPAYPATDSASVCHGWRAFFSSCSQPRHPKAKFKARHPPWLVASTPPQMPVINQPSQIHIGKYDMLKTTNYIMIN